MTALEALRTSCAASVYLPGDTAYATARLPWNLAVDQRPAAVAFPRSTADMVAVVLAARTAGLRVAVQGTGHNAGPLGPLDDVVLVRTNEMRDITVDASANRVTVGAGALWGEVVAAADEAGCAVLHGSSPDVGVVGYSLGGGISWYARELGLQCSAITGAEVVSADGSVRWVDAESDPDLLWALRGGGGNLGAVTALEFRSFPFTTAYAGMLIFDITAAERVLRAYAEWAATAPDAVTTSFRLLQVPPIDEAPPALRGRRIVVIDGAVLDDDQAAEAILAPLRALGPEVDTFARVPTGALSRLHMDPEGPTPAVSRSAVLRALPPEAMTALLGVAGPDHQSSLLLVELRQLGGALGRPATDASALRSVGDGFVLFAAAIAPDAEAGRQGLLDATLVMEAMRAWHADGLYLNFVEEDCTVSRGYHPEDWARLVAIRDRVDPDGLFVANHPVSAASHRAL